MCIVVDTNAIAQVFDPANKQHSEFKPVRDWLVTGKRAKFVYGGSKYKAELKRLIRFLPIIAELERAGRTLALDDRQVDAEEKRISNQINDRRFNDPHLAAIICVSRCKLICSNDHEAFPFLSKRELYAKSNCGCPKVYTRAKNRRLLSKNNIAKCCE